MAFINLEHVDTNFGKTTPIKCPICHNDFLVGADDSQSHGWPCLFHVPRVISKDEEFIEKDELTCPFLLKPLVLPCEFGAASYKDPLVVSFKDFLVDDDIDNTWIAPEKFLQESIKQYSCMLKLNGTTCKYCGDKYEFSYGFDEDSGKFYCNFSCGCISVEGAEDLSRLALGFAREYDKKATEHDKRTDYINAVISRMPKGAKMLGTPTAPSTLNSRTLLDTDPDLQGELEGLSFLDIQDVDEERRQVAELQRRNAGYSLSDIVDEGTDEDVSKLDYSDLDVDEETVSDPEGLYSFAAENRTTDSGLEKVAIDPTFIENLFLGTKNAPQHTGKYNIESYIVHDSAGRTDYVLMYNKSTGKAGISPLGVFYGLRLRVTELDDQRFREMVKNYGGAVEAEHRALLSIADGGCTPYKDDQDESIGGISTTIGNKLVDRRMLVSLRSTKSTGTMLYAGDYHGYFNIDRESFINNGYYEYIKNTPYMYTPDDSGDTVELFKDAFYMFTDDEIDWNVLTELLKKLPEGVRIQVPGPFSMSGSFWEVKTVGFVNGLLAKQV